MIKEEILEKRVLQCIKADENKFKFYEIYLTKSEDGDYEVYCLYGRIGQRGSRKNYYKGYSLEEAASMVNKLVIQKSKEYTEVAV